MSITRNKNGKPRTVCDTFFGERDYNLDISMGREYFEGDIGIPFILYSIDHARSQIGKKFDYGTPKKTDIIFKEAVELIGNVNLEKGEPTKMGSSSLKVENLAGAVFLVYQAQLDEKNVQVNEGDFIGYNIHPDHTVYFEVVNPNYINYDNPATIARYSSFYRRLKCAYVQYDVFNGEQPPPFRSV